MSHRISSANRRVASYIFLLVLLLSSAGVAQDETRSRIHLVIDKSDFKLYVFDADKPMHTFPIAVGKNAGDKQRVGDYRTPEGKFYISKIQDSRAWSHDFRDGKGKIKGAYGPWFLRLYTGANATKSGKAWTGIAIHGTHDPSLIGKMVTEGCVRLRNNDVQVLKGMISVGTRVTIRE